MKSFLKAAAFAAVSLALAACATVGQPVQLSEGDWVLARWQEDREWYFPAVVTAREGDVLTMLYDDGDVGSQPSENVRPFDWQTGTVVSCRWTDGAWYPARIARMDADRYNIEILFDDGDKLAANTSVCRSPG
jgi:opacity protein-like surface antigen